MSNSQGQRRRIIRLPEIPRSSTPEPAPKRQRTSRNTSKNIVNIPRETRPRVNRSPRRVEPAEPTRVIDSAERLSDPFEDRPEEAVETAEPAAGVIDSSERSSDPLGYQAATPDRDPEEAAIEDAIVMSSLARVNDTSERSSQPEDR